MENLVLIIGIVISPIVTVLGLFLNHRSNKIAAEALARKNESEADKITAEANLIGTNTMAQQIAHITSIVETLRAEVEELRQQRGEMEIENMTLRQQVTAQSLKIDAQEYQIINLKRVVDSLSGKL
jgi:hypothetical protein